MPTADEPVEPITDQRPKINPYFAIIILTIPTFMELLDTNVVNVSIPQIAADVNSTPTETSWIIASYLVANVMILPISGWLAIRLGRKTYYQTCLMIFIVSSLLCGLATNLSLLIFFRIIQGLSGSGLATSSQAIIADIFPPEKLGKAFSIYAIGIVCAPVVGPTFGGWITDTLTWHWIFFINVPIGLVAFFLIRRFISESERSKAFRLQMLKTGKRVDWVGIILIVTGFAALQIVLEEGNRESWFESNFILFTSIIAVVTIIVGLTWEYYQDHPAVDLSLFANLNFSISCILLFTNRFIMTGSTFLVPFLAQELLDYSATNAGLLLLPGALTLLVMMPIVGYLTDKLDARKIIFFGSVIFSIALWNLTSLNLQADFNDLAIYRTYQIFGLSFLSATMMTVGFYYVPPEKNDTASAMISLSSNIGASLGIAVSTTLITRNTQFHLNHLSSQITNFNPNYLEALKELTQTLENQGLTIVQATAKAQSVIMSNVSREAALLAILDVFWIYLAMVILTIPIVFFLKPKKQR